MLRGLFLGIGFLLLVSTVVESVVTSGQPGALSTCYSIPESRARLAAKDKLDALDLNFTDIGLNYITLYQELEMISMKNVEYQKEKYVEINCTLVDLCKTTKTVDGILDLMLPTSVGFLTNVIKIDARNVEAYLFDNKTSVLINERDFAVFMLDGLRVDLHADQPGRLILFG